MTTPIAPIAWATQAAPSQVVASPATDVGAGDFINRLHAGATDLVADTGRANELLSAYALGENIAPHELVMAMEQAKLSLQMAVEVRNRIVDAYQELTRMQV